MEDKIRQRRESHETISQPLEGNTVFRRKAKVKEAKKKKVVRLSEETYHFLQYNAFIRKWATESLGATQEELDVLLWMLPVNIFTRVEYREQMVGPFEPFKTKFDHFVQKGWVIKWQQSDRAYYTLSRRVIKILQEMHKMYFTENIDDISIGFKPPENREVDSLLTMYQKMFDRGTAKKG